MVIEHMIMVCKRRPHTLYLTLLANSS